MVTALATMWALAGCSHTHPGTHPGPASSPPSSRPAAGPTGPGAAPPGAVGLSPAGVTTRVDAPADATEEQYFQACHAAKAWMDAQPRADQPLLEPYLAMVQATPSGTPGTWNVPWAQLSPARQAAVITATRAAAADECG